LVAQAEPPHFSFTVVHTHPDGSELGAKSGQLKISSMGFRIIDPRRRMAERRKKLEIRAVT
jgi:phage head maturation protease